MDKQSFQANVIRLEVRRHMGAVVALLLVQMLTAATAHQQDHLCPLSCHCSTYKVECTELLPTALWDEIRVLNVTSANLSHLHNISVGKVTSNIKVLYLTGNYMENIRDTTFSKWTSLEFLICDRSHILKIHPKTFYELHRLESLSLRGNPLHLFPFVVSSKLRILNLASCNITELPNDFFVHLIYLEDLQLSSNNLVVLDNMSFYWLINLKYLYIDGNQVVSIQNETFSVLNNLRILDLSRNLIKKLSPNLFSQQSKLDTLYLSHNQLKYIVPYLFDPLINLRILHLEYNQLQNLDENIFTNLISLNFLYMENNEISNIDKTVLVNLKNVTHLYLSSNKLKEFSVCSLYEMDNLMYLRLFGNDLQTDCDLWNVRKWSVDHKVQLWSHELLKNDKLDILLGNMDCNVTDCSEIVEVDPLDLSFLFYVVSIAVPCSVILIAIIICCCLRYRKKPRNLDPVQYINRNTYDIVAESSHSTTETEAIQVYEYHNSSLVIPQKNCNGNYAEPHVQTLPIKTVKNHRHIGPIYSTSEDEEEALLTTRRQQSLRVPRQQRRVLPRPMSMQSANESNVCHFSDTEPQSSTLSDYSDSNCDITEPSSQGLV